MSIFSVFEVFTVFCIFPHKGKCFEHGKGDIRDQQHKKNQNMYKKLKKEMCSNFALFAPYINRNFQEISKISLFISYRHGKISKALGSPTSKGTRNFRNFRNYQNLPIISEITKISCTSWGRPA
jgi:hypothetical protein